MSTDQESEEVVAARIVEWLQNQDFDVYQEVQIASYSKRADIVAKRGRLIYVVEVKTNFSLAAVQQASKWAGLANMVSIGLPKLRHNPTVRRFLEFTGIGVITSQYETFELIAPRFFRKRLLTLENTLREEHKTFAAAGNNRSDFYSPFKATGRALRTYLRRVGRANLKDVVRSIPHHYYSPSSARGAIQKWAELGRFDGVKAVKEGGKIFLEYQPTPAPGTATGSQD